MIYRPAKNIAKELRKGKLYRQSAAVHVSDKKHKEAYDRMRADPSHSHESDEQVHQRAAYYLVWHQHGRPKARWRKRVLFGAVLAIVVLVVLAGTAHCQIDVIQFQQNGTPVASFAAPFKMNFAGCTVGRSASTLTITCSSGTNTPGGSDKQVQYNSAGSAFGGIAFGTNGQVLESCGTNCTPQFQDPIVSGPDAPAAASTKNPVQVAGNDGSVVRAIKTDTSGNVGVVFPSAQHVVVDTAPTTAVTGTFWQGTQPVSGTVAAGVPALGQALAASSLPVVLTAAQLSTLTPPAVFGGVVTQGTGTNLHTVVDSGAVTATLGAETTKVIGTVNQGTSPWVTSSTLAAETTKVIGTVNQGTSPWVTSATLAAETTKVIGTVNVAGSQTIGLAAGSQVIGHVVADSGSTTAVTQGTGSNLHAVIDTGSTTAVTQATATNLHTAATLDAETTKVIGTARVIGNTGAVFDAATNGAVPASQVWTVSTPTTAAGGALTTSVKATVTTSVNVKASAGNVYGLSVANGAAAVCWVQFINSAGNGSIGVGVVFSIAMPSSGVVTIPPEALALANFSTGIAVAVASSTNSTTACGTGANMTVFYQ